jgi:hypothetical protein
VGYAFESSRWAACRLVPVELGQVFRQKDERLIALLNGVRVGDIQPWMTDMLDKAARPLPTDDGIQPTVLFPTRAEAQKRNADVGGGVEVLVCGSGGVWLLAGIATAAVCEVLHHDSRPSLPGACSASSAHSTACSATSQSSM